MIKVFFGGSRRIGRLNQALKERADSIISKGYLFLLGDANGADRAMQQYLAEKNYKNVVVFCMGDSCRNNVGSWTARNIRTERNNKDFNYYSIKDAIMSDEADYGFMIWDGKSKGTLNNILNLAERNKKVLVYFSPAKSFYTLTSPRDLPELLRQCGPVAAKEFDRSIKLSQRLRSGQQHLNFA